MAKKIKIKWTVEKKTTGPYSSFHKRSWPFGTYTDFDRPAIQITCKDSYDAWRVKENNHGPLTVHIAVHKNGTFVWRKLKNTFLTLADAKAAGINFLENFPEFWPEAPQGE